MARETISTRITPEWKAELHERSKGEGVTISDLVHGLIADYLGKPKGDRVSQLERRVSSLEGKLRRLGE